MQPHCSLSQQVLPGLAGGSGSAGDTLEEGEAGRVPSSLGPRLLPPPGMLSGIMSWLKSQEPVSPGPCPSGKEPGANSRRAWAAMTRAQPRGRQSPGAGLRLTVGAWRRQVPRDRCKPQMRVAGTQERVGAEEGRGGGHCPAQPSPPATPSPPSLSLNLARLPEKSNIGNITLFQGFVLTPLSSAHFFH